jgi:Protein of unknown function (DUF2809)
MPRVTRSGRLFGVAMIVVSLGTAFGIRLFTGSTLETTGALEQISGTALYASAFYGGLLVLWPRARAALLAVASIGFCWVVEFFQLTDIPARLSAHSVVARLVLGESFDPADLVWYVLGVALAVGVHRWWLPPAVAATEPGRQSPRARRPIPPALLDHDRGDPQQGLGSPPQTGT